MKKVFCLIIALIIAILVSFYYYFYPRITLGYGNTKISLHQWNQAFPREPYTHAHLYHNRFKNKCYYKAYITYWYYAAALYMGMKEEQMPLYKKTIDKISCADINESDMPIIEHLYELYRSAFMKQLQCYHPTSETFSEIVGPCFISFYFILYYNHVIYGYDMDDNEFYTVFQWIESQNVQYDELVKDPMGIRKIDFHLCTDTAILRDWISLTTHAEFVLDVDNYEMMSNKFSRFIGANFGTNKDK